MNFKDKKGFTLIELVMVIVIIGILAAIAVPTFVNLVREAKEGSVRGLLGAWRSALAIAYANSAIGGSDPVFPTTADVQSGNCGARPCFADGKLPFNQLTNSSAVADIDSDACTCTSLVSTTVGWHYFRNKVGDQAVMFAATDDCSKSDPCAENW